MDDIRWNLNSDLTPAELATLERLIDEAFERQWNDCRLREAGVIPGWGSPAELLAVISQRHPASRTAINE